MISKMVHDDGPDGRMTPSEIVEQYGLLFIAGHDSTVNLIAHCILTCLRNPGSIDLLRRQPELVPGAIEEVLRLQSSVQFFPTRSALADIEIAGTVIPKGAPIFLLYGAGNRDPKRFPNPNEFDPARKDNRASRLGQRHSHLFRRPAGAAGSEHRLRGLSPPSREPAAGGRSAAVQAQPGVPRSAPPARRHRRNTGLGAQP